MSASRRRFTQEGKDEVCGGVISTPKLIKDAAIAYGVVSVKSGLYESVGSVSTAAHLARSRCPRREPPFSGGVS